MSATDQHLDDVIAELAILWPALPIALPRDAGTQSGERVATSENVHSIPLNPEVAAVILDLTRAIPQWTAWAAEAAGESPQATVAPLAHLRRLPALHGRLNDLGRTRDAERLATTIHGWLHHARNALGLNRPDRPIGEHCPNHDTPLAPLISPGDQGDLRYAKLDNHGHPVDAYIAWRHVDVVLCRHCDALWTPARYMWLGRLIRDATHRRDQMTESSVNDQPGDAA